MRPFAGAVFICFATRLSVNAAAYFNTLPVDPFASSVQRKATTLPISSALPTLPSGESELRKPFIYGLLLIAELLKPVSTRPGATTLAVIPFAPSSFARYLVNVSNTETFTWTGAGSGTYHYITGPYISENQTSYLCVRANNACASSANYCTYITAPNNPSCGFVPRNNTANGNDIISNNKPAEFIVAPNPVGSQLNIYGITEETDAVIVLSTSGKTVYTANPKNQPQMRIDVSKLPRGMYMVILRQRDGTVINKKVMLQ